MERRCGQAAAFGAAAHGCQGATDDPEPFATRRRRDRSRDLEEFKAWQTARRARTLAETFDELRALAAPDHDVLRLPRRRDRSNAFSRKRA